MTDQRSRFEKQDMGMVSEETSLMLVVNGGSVRSFRGDGLAVHSEVLFGGSTAKDCWDITSYYFN